MSTIATLGINGIRSYSCGHQEVISFKPPLTLILGKNGSGKTTIIECLRFVTCGTLPPGTSNGKAFICDPKLVNRAEVEAQIKLKFFAINKQPILCMRKMSLRRKNNKLEFKKLEQILKTKNVDDVDITVSHTPSEIDRQVPELLGVSKAVLENVIFCHQEDSLWPFKDNLTLKSIFDELFETTKFTKLYDTLQRLYKDNKKKLKEEKSSLDHAKFGYESLVNDMKQLQGIIENIRRNMNEIKTEKKRKDQLQSSLRAENYEERLRLVVNSKNLNEYKLEELKKRVNHLLDKLTDVDHPGTDKLPLELKREFLSRLELESINIEQELLVHKADLETSGKELKLLKESTVDFDVGEEKKEVLRLSNELFELLGIQDKKDKMDTRQLVEFANSEINERDIEIIDKEKSIVEKRNDNLGFLINEKAKMQLLERDRERLEIYLKELYKGNRIDELKGLEEQKKKLNAENEKQMAEYSTFKAQRSEIDRSISSLIQQLKDDSEMKKKIELAQEFVDWVNCKKELALLKEKKEATKDRIRLEPHEQMSFLGLEEKLKKMDTLKCKAESDVKEAERKKIEIEAVLANNDKLKLEFAAENEAILSAVRAAVDHKYPPEMDIYKRLIEVKGHIRRLETDLNSAAYVKNEFLMTLVETSNEMKKCLLCEKDFDEERYQARKLHFEEISKGVTPEEIEREKELEDFRKEYAILKKHKPDIEKVQMNLQRAQRMDEELDSLHAGLGKANHKIHQSREEKQRLERECYDLKQMQLLISDEEKCLEKLQKVNPAKFADQDQEHLLRLHQRGQQLQQDIPSLLSDKKTSLEIVDHNMNTLNQKILDLNRLIRDLSGKIQAIRDERKNEKTQEEIEHDLKALADDIAAKAASLATVEAELARDLEAREKQLLNDRATYARLVYLLPDLEKRHEKLLRLNTSTVDENLIMETYRKFKDTERAVEELKSTVEEKSKKVDRLREEILLVKDKIELEVGEKSIRELEDKVTIENGEILVLEEKVKEEKQTALMLSEANSKVSRLEGIDEAHKKSAEDLYARIYAHRDKEMHYFEKLTHYEYYRLLVEDLELYIQSLESALVKYHKEKIEMINKNIAELWKLTYQNGDIKRIEIKAEQIVDPNADSKGNFHYRVMFYNRDDAQMEMRGRSSMGQKVLASIVIRIALAEAFGINCGILALDEPTNNLDKNNIESLARFLADLIDQRRTDANFQLIIITHDKDFIKMFNDYTDHYLHVSKNDAGFSTIVRKDIDEIIHAL